MFNVTVNRVRFGLDQRGTDPHTRQLVPMLLQKADAVFSSPDWNSIKDAPRKPPAAKTG